MNELDNPIYVVMEHFTSHSNPIAISDDQELAERYAAAMEKTTDSWHCYTVEAAEWLTERLVEITEPDEEDDYEYEQERMHQEADSQYHDNY